MGKACRFVANEIPIQVSQCDQFNVCSVTERGLLPGKTQFRIESSGKKTLTPVDILQTMTTVKMQPAELKSTFVVN